MHMTEDEPKLWLRVLSDSASRRGPGSSGEARDKRIDTQKQSRGPDDDEPALVSEARARQYIKEIALWCRFIMILSICAGIVTCSVAFLSWVS